MTKNSSYIILSALAALALSSCSLFGGKGIVTKGDSQTARPNTETVVNKKPDKGDAARKKQAASQLAGKINGEWVIVGVGQHTVSLSLIHI